MFMINRYRTEQRRFLEKPICHHMCKHVWILQWGVEQGSFIGGVIEKRDGGANMINTVQHLILNGLVEHLNVIATWMFPNSHCSYAAASFGGITPETDWELAASRNASEGKSHVEPVQKCVAYVASIRLAAHRVTCHNIV